jgi:hypothetical protein
MRSLRTWRPPWARLATITLVTTVAYVARITTFAALTPFAALTTISLITLWTRSPRNCSNLQKFGLQFLDTILKTGEFCAQRIANIATGERRGHWVSTN